MRRGGISLIIALICMAVGIGLGLLYAWKLDPRVEFDTHPWQLSDEGKRQYVIAVSLAFAKDHDLNAAAVRLSTDLDYGPKSWQAVADTACDLARTSYVSTNTGLTAVRAMVELAKSQGITSCASTLLPLYTSTPAPTPTAITATPTLIPPSTKTPTPTLGPTFTPELPSPEALTPTPAGNFRLALVEPYCSTQQPGLIEITVQDSDGVGLPGIPVEVSTATTKDDFFTGLKAEKGSGYADFNMTEGGAYVVSLPNISDRSRPLEASSCNVAQKDGGKSVVSYRVTFRRLVGS
jgi:hypothetical protein